MIQATLKRFRHKSNRHVLAHDDFFNKLRSKNYANLDEEGHVYLDYTGGNVTSKYQIEEHSRFLLNNTLGNPHSSNPTSQLSTQLVEEARKKVLSFFNDEDYHCVFTANASGALKIVGECYPFEESGHFLLFTDNHNSVNGIREYCLNANGTYDYVPMNVEDLTVAEEALKEKIGDNRAKNKLFAFPAQSNVSGIKHSLEWIEYAQEFAWDVLLDAAAFAPTSKLDLKKYRPDFVSISFYKIFGYPTGIGCLLVRKDKFEKLHKRWFAGGTVSLASAKAPYHFLMNNYERYENGTINNQGIPAFKIGLEFIESIGMSRLNERVDGLMSYLFAKLKILRHQNGQPQLAIIGHPQRENTGGTMVMVFLNPDGSKVQFEKIEELANRRKISLRSGCFCNPGLDETQNCLTSEELSSYFESRESGDYYEMMAHLNKMRGATRISVGIATNKQDLDSYIQFVEELKDQTL
jgi:selenocysteine lyase/cysteine desulfurase